MVMNVLKAHEKLMNIATWFKKIISENESDTPLLVTTHVKRNDIRNEEHCKKSSLGEQNGVCPHEAFE